jgi:hypothetical protein
MEVKYAIDDNELYPFYTINDLRTSFRDLPYYQQYVFTPSPELLTQYERVMGEFYSLQDMLRILQKDTSDRYHGRK